MNKITIAVSLFLVLLGITACSLEELFEKEEKLPEITLETRKAFGFLLDGKVWRPKGYDGFSNYDVDIDPGFSDGVLSILVYRYPKSGGKGDGYQHFRIGSDSLRSTGLYPIEKGSRQNFVFYDRDTNCEYRAKDSTCQYSGYLNITTYDYDLGKVQGEFELTITKPGCETVKITDGRFAWQYQ